jgi:ABC-type bacteriocin/lantibiotic exporter with double-glycine peptidase domain
MEYLTLIVVIYSLITLFFIPIVIDSLGTNNEFTLLEVVLIALLWPIRVSKFFMYIFRNELKIDFTKIKSYFKNI